MNSDSSYIVHKGHRCKPGPRFRLLRITRNRARSCRTGWAGLHRVPGRGPAHGCRPPWAGQPLRGRIPRGSARPGSFSRPGFPQVRAGPVDGDHPPTASRSFAVDRSLTGRLVAALPGLHPARVGSRVARVARPPCLVRARLAPGSPALPGSRPARRTRTRPVRRGLVRRLVRRLVRLPGGRSPPDGSGRVAPGRAVGSPGRSTPSRVHRPVSAAGGWSLGPRSHDLPMIEHAVFVHVPAMFTRSCSHEPSGPPHGPRDPPTLSKIITACAPPPRRCSSSPRPAPSTAARPATSPRRSPTRAPPAPTR